MADKNQGLGEISLVGKGSKVEGSISTDGGIRIDGTVVGEIKAKSTAAVGEGGVVEGSLTAKSISVAGKVQGNLTATEKLTLEARSIVSGDIRAARLIVDEGAVFDGKCKMSSGAPDPAAKT
ncbi:MAG: polymer-forming cytoskeletal protein [Ignavibacteria bacterium]|nr:polymer-forming cytoskeletal protein [Ignavibacteria bacterium]